MWSLGFEERSLYSGGASGGFSVLQQISLLIASRDTTGYNGSWVTGHTHRATSGLYGGKTFHTRLPLSALTCLLRPRQPCCLFVLALGGLVGWAGQLNCEPRDRDTSFASASHDTLYNRQSAFSHRASYSQLHSAAATLPPRSECVYTGGIMFGVDKTGSNKCPGYGSFDHGFILSKSRTRCW